MQAASFQWLHCHSFYRLTVNIFCHLCLWERGLITIELCSNPLVQTGQWLNKPLWIMWRKLMALMIFNLLLLLYDYILIVCETIVRHSSCWFTIQSIWSIFIQTFKAVIYNVKYILCTCNCACYLVTTIIYSNEALLQVHASYELEPRFWKQTIWYIIPVQNFAKTEESFGRKQE